MTRAYRHIGWLVLSHVVWYACNLMCKLHEKNDEWGVSVYSLLCGLACAWIHRWTRWIRLFLSSLWWWTCHDIHLAVYQQNFASRSSALRPCKCRLVILHELGDRLETSFPLSQHCVGMARRTVSRCSFPQLFEQCCGPPSCCPAAISHNFSNHHAAAIAAATAHARYFWENNTWRKSWCWRSLVNSHVSALWDHSLDTVCWHSAVSDDRRRFRLPKRHAFLLCPPKMKVANSILSVLPTCFAVNVSGLVRSSQ